MASASDVKHLTEFGADGEVEDLDDRTPDDAVEFDPFYDGHVVDPWARGPNELVRLYFDDDDRGDTYVPVEHAERIEGDVRSTPVGRPMRDSDSDDGPGDRAEPVDPEESDGTFDVEEAVDVDGTEYDLLWHAGSDDADERVVVAAAFDGADA